MSAPKKATFKRKKKHSSSSSRPQRPQRAHQRKVRQSRDFKQPPTIFPAEIVVISDDGEPFALPEERSLASIYPRILVDPTADIALGDKLMIEIIDRDSEGTYMANVLKVTEDDTYPTFIGVFKNELSYGRVRAMHKELAALDFFIAEKMADEDRPDEGEIVRVQPGATNKRGPIPVKIIERFGVNPSGIESVIALENHAIPVDFSQEVITASEELPATLSKQDYAEREDLRAIPLVTIDGADARDFDDAVWAERTKQGFHIIVAIADVAHYISPRSPLDKEAFNRGNSTYFPDRVVPMLPERISNDLCSLRPHEDRPVLAVHLFINESGKLTKYQFSRAVIHSHARLTYEEAQAALDGAKEVVEEPIVQSTLLPLFEAYKVLQHARGNRGAIDLDIPEPKLVMDDNGAIVELDNRARLDAHMLIEEMMILANVAAAKALDTAGAPALYRIHPMPGKEKLLSLRTVMDSHNLGFTKSPNPTQHAFRKLVDNVRGHKAANALMRLILQSQMQAKYDAENTGHYGLALTHYTHFTSPIRRYSDLIVHRALIEQLKLNGQGGHFYKPKKLKLISEHINVTERRSQHAEWEARDRLIAKFYTHYVGKEFKATVMSVQKFGVFVSINSVAEGLVPLRLMTGDHYLYNEKTRTLRGKRTKEEIRPGSVLKVHLTEADIVTGKLTFKSA